MGSSFSDTLKTISTGGLNKAGGIVEDVIEQIPFIGDSINASKALADAQEEATAQSAAAQTVQDQQQTRQQVREDRVRRAQLVQQAESSGAGISSAVAGTAAALSTNLSANLAFNSGQQQTAANATEVNQDISELNLKKQLNDQYAQLAMTAGTALF